MSEWNRQGEECDCGSTTAHKRSPGCTPPTRDTIIHEWDGAPAVDGNLTSRCGETHPVDAYCMSIGNTRPANCQRCAGARRRFEAAIYERRGYVPPSVTMPGDFWGPLDTVPASVARARDVPPPTPAAMLGEALGLLERARVLVERARSRGAGGAVMNHDAKGPKTGRRLERRLSEVEREIATDAGLCWQCDAPLGATEKCTTCEAKRMEGQR